MSFALKNGDAIQFSCFRDGIRKETIRKDFNGVTEFLIKEKKSKLLNNGEFHKFVKKNAIEITDQVPESWMGA